MWSITTRSRRNHRRLSGLARPIERLEDRTVPSQFGPWGTPVNLGPVVNSPSNDQHPAISKDGLSLYITSSRPGGFGGLDLWVSHRDSAESPWQPPVNLGPTINTAVDERVPTFSRDGHWMLFGSINRPGGFGATDLWASYREHVHDDFGWQAPVNLGPNVNTATDEDGATLFPDDESGVTTLYFTSLNRAGHLGTDWDIYASTLNPDGTFGPAAPVTELNVPGGPTNGRDTRTAIRHDAREILITSNRPGGQGGNDLWVSTRASTSEPWSAPVNLGPVVNGRFLDGAPALSSDGQTLFFYSDRPGGVGSFDLYMTMRQRVHGRSGHDEPASLASDSLAVEHPPAPPADAGMVRRSLPDILARPLVEPEHAAEGAREKADSSPQRPLNTAPSSADDVAESSVDLSPDLFGRRLGDDLIRSLA
jgi:WD40-like Beta Propeller Repeat